MCSVEMRGSRPRKVSVESAGTESRYGWTSGCREDRPLAASRSVTVWVYWTVDSFIRGATPGSVPGSSTGDDPVPGSSPSLWHAKRISAMVMHAPVRSDHYCTEVRSSGADLVPHRRGGGGAPGGAGVGDLHLVRARPVEV